MKAAPIAENRHFRLAQTPHRSSTGGECCRDRDGTRSLPLPIARSDDTIPNSVRCVAPFCPLEVFKQNQILARTNHNSDSSLGIVSDAVILGERSGDAAGSAGAARFCPDVSRSTTRVRENNALAPGHHPSFKQRWSSRSPLALRANGCPGRG